MGLGQGLGSCWYTYSGPVALAWHVVGHVMVRVCDRLRPRWGLLLRWLCSAAGALWHALLQDAMLPSMLHVLVCDNNSDELLAGGGAAAADRGGTAHSPQGQPAAQRAAGGHRRQAQRGQVQPHERVDPHQQGHRDRHRGHNTRRGGGWPCGELLLEPHCWLWPRCWCIKQSLP
jgi:hypothetical protein